MICCAKIIEQAPQQMIKTDTFFIISNYNTDPEQYLHYCEDYHIYDQSDKVEIQERLKKKYSKISFVENSGHSITNYFRFFIENYENLPDYMMLVKANMIGRHISQEYFDRVYNNKFYTCLYDDRGWEDKLGVAYQLYDGAFLEINNSWYASAKPHKYFTTYNQLLTFVFKNPIIPQWLLFSPGACYIVSREQVLKYPKEFYVNLKYLVSYTHFPSEAYHIERMLNVIFCANYEINPHMAEVSVFQRRLEECEMHNEVTLKQDGVLFNRIKRSVIYRYNNFILRQLKE